MNTFRVAVSTLALAALLGTLLCPWWRYRADRDLSAAFVSHQAAAEFLEQSGASSNGTTAALDTHVGIKPIWDAQNYEVHDWLPFNIIQMAGIVAAWGWGLSVARRMEERSAPVTATVTN